MRFENLWMEASQGVDRMRRTITTTSYSFDYPELDPFQIVKAMLRDLTEGVREGAKGPYPDPWPEWLMRFEVGLYLQIGGYDRPIASRGITAHDRMWLRDAPAFMLQQEERFLRALRAEMLEQVSDDKLVAQIDRHWAAAAAEPPLFAKEFPT